VSQLVGNALPNFWLTWDDDPRSLQRNARVDRPARDGILCIYPEDKLGTRGETIIQPYLPSKFYGDQAIDIGILDAPEWVIPPPLPGGCEARLGFNGFTRDASGGVIPGVTVKCMLTLDDTKQSETVSDENGYFIVSTAVAGGHYLIFYKADIVDISGTTVNTLQGA
jgi:hypothetical protein